MALWRLEERHSFVLVLKIRVFNSDAVGALRRLSCTFACISKWCK